MQYFKIISNFTHLTAREITYNSFEISRVVFMLNIPTDHSITLYKFLTHQSLSRWPHFTNFWRVYIGRNLCGCGHAYALASRPCTTAILIKRIVSLRSWWYCVGARLKFWRQSRVPKKWSRDEAVEIPPARKPRYFE